MKTILSNEISAINRALLNNIAALNPTDAVQLTGNAIAVNLENGITAVFESNGIYASQVSITSECHKRMQINIYNNYATDLCTKIPKAITEWLKMMKVSK